MLNHSINTTDVLWVPNLDVPMNLLPLSLKQQIFRFSIIGVGIFLNCILFLIISTSRQLRYPRHLFWLALSIINQFYLIQSILEVVAIVHKDHVACQIYVLHAGVGYSLLLICLSLAGLDRYLAIAQQEWYKRRVTNRTVTITLCVAAFITYVAITSPFWTGYKRISTCTVNLTHMNYVLCWNLLLGIFCIILHVKIYIISRAAIRRCPSHVNKFRIPVNFQFYQSSDAHELKPITINCTRIPLSKQQPVEQPRDEILSDKRDEETKTSPPSTSFSGNKKKKGLFLLFRPKINLLEIRAAIHLSINVLPFWVCTFPVSCNAIAIYWCIRLETECSVVFTINPYLRDMFLFHSIYNPMMYMLSSCEFRRAMSNVIQKIVSTICCFLNGRR